MSDIKMMELVRKVFAYTEEDVCSVRRFYNMTQEEIDKDCEIIEKWMKQQAHFPDDYDKRRVERILLRNKFQVERTKKKLENYYTIRGVNQDFLLKMDPHNEAMQTVFETLWATPIPKLMNGTDRIFLCRLGKNDHLFSLEHTLLLLHASLELEILHDYAVGVKYLIDFEYLSFAHIKNLDFNMIAKSILLFEEALSARILSLEYINLSPAMNILMNILKQSLPVKMYNKINIHADLESLKKSIPEDYLPKEYGGKMGSFYDMSDYIKEIYLQNGDFLMKRAQTVANKNKRVGKVQKNEQFGVDGTFKNINLD